MKITQMNSQFINICVFCFMQNCQNRTYFYNTLKRHFRMTYDRKCQFTAVNIVEDFYFIDNRKIDVLDDDNDFMDPFHA